MTTLSAGGRSPIDDAKVSRFHYKLAAYTSGGSFCDGYILGLIGPALLVYNNGQPLSPLWNGLIGASAIIGLFLGGLVFGRIADLVGRQKLYVGLLVAFVVCSLAQAVADQVTALFALRLVMGLAMGAEFSIGPTLMAEFTPRRFRGALLSTLSATWTLGYVAAFVVGTLLASTGSESWR